MAVATFLLQDISVLPSPDAASKGSGGNTSERLCGNSQWPAGFDGEIKKKHESLRRQEKGN